MKRVKYLYNNVIKYTKLIINKRKEKKRNSLIVVDQYTCIIPIYIRVN